MQGGERVIRHLGPRGGHRADKGGFAGVGHAQQANVGQHLELQLQLALLARLAVGELARRAVDRAFKVDIAQPALAATGDDDFHAVGGQVGHHFAGQRIGNQRAHRHAQDNIVRALAIAVGAPAVFAVAGDVFFHKAVVHQGVDVFVRHGNHIAAAPAVTAIRAAARDEFFPAHAGRAIAALAAAHFDARFVDEFHVTLLERSQAWPRCARGNGEPSAAAPGRGSWFTAAPQTTKRALSWDRALMTLKLRVNYAASASPVYGSTVTVLRLAAPLTSNLT